MSESGEIHTTGKKIYTVAGSDCSDKSHLCAGMNVKIRRPIY